MIIENSAGNPILTLDDWQSLCYPPPNDKHWKKDRSAYSIADIILNHNGAEIIRSRVTEAIKTSVSIERIIPEYEVKFDDLGKGRVHDLGCFGYAGGKTVFIGVEAKVDEPFGQTVLDQYLSMKAKQIVGISTNAPERIEYLLAQHFTKPKLSMFDIRYQLLYATVGTIAAGADISVLFVMVLKTKLYDRKIGCKNYSDYNRFMKTVGAKPLNSSTRTHLLTIQDKRLICLYESFPH